MVSDNRKDKPPVSTPEEAEALYKDGMIRSDPNEPVGEQDPEDVIWNKPQVPLSEMEETGPNPDQKKP